jgi:hypothetical protein
VQRSRFAGVLVVLAVIALCALDIAVDDVRRRAVGVPGAPA